MMQRSGPDLGDGVAGGRPGPLPCTGKLTSSWHHFHAKIKTRCGLRFAPRNKTCAQGRRLCVRFATHPQQSVAGPFPYGGNVCLLIRRGQGRHVPPTSGALRIGPGVGVTVAFIESQPMLKKLDHPIVLVTLCSCFFAGFGFAVGEAVQRVSDACTVDAVCQGKNILELAGKYFDPRLTLFTVVLVIVGAVEAGFSINQLRLKRQLTRAAVKAETTAREVANETRALLAGLNEYAFERELWIAITDAMKKAS
jgi:hypothetical protein